jgi:type II secretory pathway pseudopilin PulG
MLIVVLVILVIVALVLVAVLVTRFGRRNYQRYSGLERQASAAKRARDAGADRLKSAERHLVEAQRELVTIGEHDQVQAIERLRTRLSTLADRLRYAAYGYSLLGSPNPGARGRARRAAGTRRRDDHGDQSIVELSEHVSSTAEPGRSPTSNPCDRLLTICTPHSTGDGRSGGELMPLESLACTSCRSADVSFCPGGGMPALGGA